MVGKAKQNALILLSVVVVLTLILAMSLPTLVLSPGQPFSLGQPKAELPGIFSPLPGSDALIWFFRGLLALALILFPVYIVYSLLTAEGRQRLIGNIILISLVFLVADYLHNQAVDDRARQAEQTVVPPTSVAVTSDVPTAIFPTTPPAWLTVLVILVASMVIVASIFIAIRFFRQRTKGPEFSLEELAKEAQTAIESLHAGGDFRAAVIQCYQEMVRVVKEERAIARETTMTAREFEDRLTSKGLPSEAIKTLTRLFEQVRYGGLALDTHDEHLALACLTAIVNACQATGAHYEGR